MGMITMLETITIDTVKLFCVARPLLFFYFLGFLLHGINAFCTLFILITIKITIKIAEACWQKFNSRT